MCSILTGERMRLFVLLLPPPNHILAFMLARMMLRTLQENAYIIRYDHAFCTAYLLFVLILAPK